MRETGGAFEYVYCGVERGAFLHASIRTTGDVHAHVIDRSVSNAMPPWTLQVALIGSRR